MRRGCPGALTPASLRQFARSELPCRWDRPSRRRTPGSRLAAWVTLTIPLPPCLNLNAAACSALSRPRVPFEDYEFPGRQTENGVSTDTYRHGAWFLDSEGNIRTNSH